MDPNYIYVRWYPNSYKATDMKFIDHQIPDSAPPSTGSATPVTNEAVSEHNHKTACATSSGSPA